MKEEVERLIGQGLNGLGAWETTQFYRGSLFIFFDFLIS